MSVRNIRSIAGLEVTEKFDLIYFFGWVAWWLGGWLRKAENKAKAQHSWGLGLAELGKNPYPYPYC